MPPVKLITNFYFMGGFYFLKKLLFILSFVLIFSLPAMAVTEKEFERICRSGSVQKLQTVIANEKNFSRLRFHEMDTPLIIAAKKSKNPEILKIIIETDVDVNAQNEDGESALIEIMDEPINLECVKVLLSNGADPNLKDEDGKTALMKALDDDLPADVINALLDSGADVKAKDRKGRDIFHYAKKAYSLHGTDTMKRLEAMAK